MEGTHAAVLRVVEGPTMRRWVVVLLCVAVAGSLLAGGAAWAVHSSERGAGFEREVQRLAATLDLKPGMTVAEIGAGRGRMAVRVARRLGPGGRLYATEIEAGKLEAIRQAALNAGVDNLETIAGAAEAAGLPGACCDVIYMRRVYHHFDQPAAMNRALYAALKPGGRLAVIDFLSPRWLFFLRHGIPRQTVSDQVIKAGFTIERTIERWAPASYLLLFRKPAR